MGDQTQGQYIGLFVFIGIVICLIAGLIYLKIRWTNQDKAKKFGRKETVNTVVKDTRNSK
jgi:uncharacterized membrane protein YciS (DUF1049 family)